MVITLHREYRALAALAVAQGWEISYTRGSHLKWRNPQGQTVITSSTPSDSRSIKNAKAFLKRYGLVIE